VTLLCALYKKFIIKVRKYGFLVSVSFSSIMCYIPHFISFFMTIPEIMK